MSLLSWLFKKHEPPPPLHHPRLGHFDWEPEGWWKGCATASGDRLAIYISGTQDGLAPSLVEPAVYALGRWPSHREEMFKFIRNHLDEFPDTDPERFKPVEVSWLWPDRPEYFVVDLELDGDDEGCWKVEFENRQPQYLVRDD